jgi:hypothetical protein
MLKNLIKPGRVIFLELAKGDQGDPQQGIEIYQITCIDPYGASVVAFNANAERSEKTLLIICTKKDSVQLATVTPGSVTGQQIKLKDIDLYINK